MAIWVAFSTGVGQILAKTWYFPLSLVLDMALCCFASWVASKGATGEGEGGRMGGPGGCTMVSKKQKLFMFVMCQALLMTLGGHHPVHS